MARELGSSPEFIGMALEATVRLGKGIESKRRPR